MAGTEKKLSAEDLPTGKFLNRVSENVDADYIRSIASDLDIKDSTFSQLSSDIHGARDLIYRVRLRFFLVFWYKRILVYHSTMQTD